MATRWMDRVLPNVAELAERQAKRTVFTRFIPPVRPEDMPGRWRAYYTFWREATRERVDPGLLDLVPALARLVPPATIIDKPVYSPFAGRRLPALLRARDTDVLVITGTETDVCVLATVLGAIDRGHAVLLVTDAVCSFSDAGHDALMTLYRERFSLQVGTATTAEVLAAWRA